MSANSAKRLCTGKVDELRSGTEDVGLTGSNCCSNCRGSPSISDLLPLEMIEMILVEAVVTQTLRSSTTTCAIKKCSRHDNNLALVCPLWQQIVDGRRFKEIVLQRIAKMDPTALYKQRADSVKVTGLITSVIFAAVTMNDQMYTIQTRKQDENCLPINVYDMEFIRHRSATNQEMSFELVYTNHRTLLAVAGLEYPSALLASPKENCLFVQPFSGNDTLPAVDPQIFKIASDGTVLAHWYLDPGLEHYIMAVDSLGQRLVVSCLTFAHVFTSMGSHIATIAAGFGLVMGGIQILPSATVVVSVCYDDGLFEGQIVILEPKKTSDGRLEYEEVSYFADTVQWSAEIPYPDLDYWVHYIEAIFVDSEGCTVVRLKNDWQIVDKKMKASRAAKHGRSGKRAMILRCHFDESRGLFFFTELNKPGGRPQLFVEHLRQTV